MIIYGLLDEDREVLARLAENYAFQAERKGMVAMVVDLPDAAHVIALVDRLGKEVSQLTTLPPRRVRHFEEPSQATRSRR